MTVLDLVPGWMVMPSTWMNRNHLKLNMYFLLPPHPPSCNKPGPSQTFPLPVLDYVIYSGQRDIRKYDHKERLEKHLHIGAGLLVMFC